MVFYLNFISVSSVRDLKKDLQATMACQSFLFQFPNFSSAYPATYAIRMASPKGAPSLWGRAGGEASYLSVNVTSSE